MSYGQTTNRLLEAAEEIWNTYYCHPFVKGLGDGTLDQKKFRFYMIQDYRYLIEYAKVFALGAAKAQDMETMQLFGEYIRQITDSEMEIHRDYMKRLGISMEEAEHTGMSLENLSYTSYMLRVGYEEGPAEIAAAILSCALSYEWIAKRLLKQNPEADQHPFYGEWVAGYVSEDYHAANQRLAACLEKLTVGYTEEKLEHLKEIFLSCSRYEALFWDMSWEMRM